LTIYDLLGREVIQLLDDIMPSGLHTIVWNGKNESGKEEASGLYLFRLQTKMGIRQSKMLMVK
jgi:flagellar hook assembly protein FlgD